MNKQFLYLIGIAVFAIGLAGCLNNDNNWEDFLAEQEALKKAIYEQFVIDSTLITDYLYEKDSIAEFDDNSGIFYNIHNPGDEYTPDINSTVLVHYKGMLLNDSIFSETKSSPALFQVHNLISGWQHGLSKIGSSGSITVYLPSYHGYGTEAKKDIPANSVLIYNIELVSFY